MKNKFRILLLAAVCVLSMILVSCGGEKAYPVEFSLSDVTAKAGDIISVDLTVTSTADANAFALHQLKYDENVLEFIGFGELGDAGKKSVFGEMGLDNTDRVISILLNEAEVLTGKICEVKFKVKDNAKAGTSDVSMSCVVKNSSNQLSSIVRSGSVTVEG